MNDPVYTFLRQNCETVNRVKQISIYTKVVNLPVCRSEGTVTCMVDGFLSDHDILCPGPAGPGTRHLVYEKGCFDVTVTSLEKCLHTMYVRCVRVSVCGRHWLTGLQFCLQCADIWKRVYTLFDFTVSDVV